MVACCPKKPAQKHIQINAFFPSTDYASPFRGTASRRTHVNRPCSATGATGVDKTVFPPGFPLHFQLVVVCAYWYRRQPSRVTTTGWVSMTQVHTHNIQTRCEVWPPCSTSR
mmetsp:Transcript_16277/g.37407  ORF Transcript_16277/g.37407 Transcript_16277/m.37407 type:complete len:112 (-) Transcript_16277:754-1089(-)